MGNVSDITLTDKRSFEEVITESAIRERGCFHQSKCRELIWKQEKKYRNTRSKETKVVQVKEVQVTEVIVLQEVKVTTVVML